MGRLKPLAGQCMPWNCPEVCNHYIFKTRSLQWRHIPHCFMV